MNFFMTSLDKLPKELCLVKKAVKALIKQNHPDGITFSEICTQLQQQSIFLGTYRNLLSMTSSVLGLLVDEGAISSRGEGSSKIFMCAGHQSLH